MKKRIAFFDFDGTITTKDSLLEIIKFQKGSFRFYLGFLINAPFLIAYKIGILSNQTAKEKILQYFFGHLPVTVFQERCNNFAQTVIPSLLRPKAMEEIKKLQAAGTEIVIVSASAENWLQDWCLQNNLRLIGTKLQSKEGILTGRIEGLNCYGEEKVNRIKAMYNLSGYDEVYGYGDTKADKPMLGLASFSFYMPFR